jgi:hypothetical protein
MAMNYNLSHKTMTLLYKQFPEWPMALRGASSRYKHKSTFFLHHTPNTVWVRHSNEDIDTILSYNLNCILNMKEGTKSLWNDGQGHLSAMKTSEKVTVPISSLHKTAFTLQWIPGHPSSPKNVFSSYLVTSRFTQSPCCEHFYAQRMVLRERN